MKITKATLNFLGIVLLLGLIFTPIYFARNFAKVAGIKSISKYLVVSQVEKFPNLTFSQNADRYTITYSKYGQNQAFLGVLIVNNPTESTQTYKLEVTSGSAKVFFGQNLDDQRIQIAVPSGASVPISLISDPGSESESQIVEFVIQTN